MALDKTVKPHKHMRLLQFDNKYLIPLLTNLCGSSNGIDSPERKPRKSFSAAGGDTDADDDADGDDEVIEVVRRDVSVH